MASAKGKIISVSSVKGGVGKTTMAINLAGLYFMMKKRVLIIDADFYSGGVSTWLDIRNQKDIYMMIDSISNNRYSSITDYVTHYNNGIDVLASPKDPRSALKIEAKYIPMIFEFAKREYDVVLVDTNHLMNEVNLMILDNVDVSLLMVTNDLIDLKNMRNLIQIFKSTDKTEDKKSVDPTFKYPVTGEVLTEYAKDKLVYSNTLGEWITHTGIDIKAEKTTVVKASADGTVKAIKTDPRYGLTVVIEHTNGFSTVYSNLLTAEFVKEGEKVTSGQTIGTVGNTASFEILDESHLHFEILKNGEQIDPNMYLKSGDVIKN